MMEIEYIREDLLEDLCKRSLEDLINLYNSYLELGLLAQEWSVSASDLDNVLSALIDLQSDPEYTGHISSVATLMEATRVLLDYRCRASLQGASDHDLLGDLP